MISRKFRQKTQKPKEVSGFCSKSNYLLELAHCRLASCALSNIVHIVGYFIVYRGISLSIVYIVSYSVASNLRQKSTTLFFESCAF